MCHEASIITLVHFSCSGESTLGVISFGRVQRPSITECLKCRYIFSFFQIHYQVIFSCQVCLCLIFWKEDITKLFVFNLPPSQVVSPSRCHRQSQVGQLISEKLVRNTKNRSIKRKNNEFKASQAKIARSGIVGREFKDDHISLFEPQLSPSVLWRNLIGPPFTNLRLSICIWMQFYEENCICAN